MSQALGRLRDVVGDPLLVRAGRGMVLTPRAESLKAEVRTLVVAGQRLLAHGTSFDPLRLERAFVVHATDHVVTVLGSTLDRVLLKRAPRATLRVLPNQPDDAVSLREGAIDLAIGIYGDDLPPEIRTRTLFTDRYVCAVRKDHPRVRGNLSLSQFVELDHVQIAPRGRPGGYVDEQLEERGLSRRITRAVPYFVAGLLLVAESEAVITISERVALAFAERLALRVLAPPLPLKPYALSMIWHPRFDGDPAHALLRDAFIAAAAEAAPVAHAGARTRLSRKLRKPKR